MPHFCVTLEGQGIHIPAKDGGEPIVGFYSVARLKADNESHASELATKRCRERLRTKLETSGGTGSELSIVVESVDRCSWFKTALSPGGSFIFFRADPDA